VNIGDPWPGLDEAEMRVLGACQDFCVSRSMDGQAR
jgi:hypothetical protein